MKVSELKKGMVLQVCSDSDKIAWMTDNHPMHSGEPELRFAPTIMRSLVPGRVLEGDELIVYLGHDKEPVDPKDPSYKALVRRVMIKEETLVVMGYNFRFLEPKPEFT
tara:strand:- start:188 stop:511 length:324 start_codon:yes stop_codon:yes gene_type:complete